MWVPVGIYKFVWAHPLPFRNATERFFLVSLIMPGGDSDDLWAAIFLSCHHTQ